MGDLTPRPGWETCATCEGHGGQMHQHIVAVPGHAPGCMGETCEQTCPVPVPQPVDEWEPCPDCVSGEVPSDGLIAAAAKAEYQHTEVWREELDSHKDLWRGQTRAALLAARKHEETARNTGVTR